MKRFKLEIERRLVMEPHLIAAFNATVVTRLGRDLKSEDAFYASHGGGVILRKTALAPVIVASLAIVALAGLFGL